MGIYNHLRFEGRCPRCGTTGEFRADFRFGFRNLDTYAVGDALEWNDGSYAPADRRPPGGDVDGEGYVAECPACARDFWITVEVRGGVIASATPDAARPGMIPH